MNPQEDISALIQTLRATGALTDVAFDRHLPAPSRAVSSEYWTPVEVAVRAASWLQEAKVCRVLDVGSGAGKFCVLGALLCNATFIGLEQRSQLAEEATSLSARFGLSKRVHFEVGQFSPLCLFEADAIYLFNPFGENLYGAEDRFDETVELNHSRYARDVKAVELALDRAPPGTHLLTYNGFGGKVPRSYQEMKVDRELPNVLRLWRKGERVDR